MTGGSTRGNRERTRESNGRRIDGGVDFEALKQDVDPVPFDQFEEDPEYRDLIEGLEALSAPDDEVGFDELLDTEDSDRQEERIQSDAESMSRVDRLRRIDAAIAEIERHAEAMSSGGTDERTTRGVTRLHEGIGALEDGLSEFEEVDRRDVAETDAVDRWLDRHATPLSVELEEIGETIQGIEARVEQLESETAENTAFRRRATAAFRR